MEDCCNSPACLWITWNQVKFVDTRLWVSGTDYVLYLSHKLWPRKLRLKWVSSSGKSFWIAKFGSNVPHNDPWHSKERWTYTLESCCGQKSIATWWLYAFSRKSYTEAYIGEKWMGEEAKLWVTLMQKSTEYLDSRYSRRTMCAVAPSTLRTVHYALYIPVGLCLCDEMCLKVSFLLFG